MTGSILSHTHGVGKTYTPVFPKNNIGFKAEKINKKDQRGRVGLRRLALGAGAKPAPLKWYLITR